MMIKLGSGKRSKRNSNWRKNKIIVTCGFVFLYEYFVSIVEPSAFHFAYNIFHRRIIDIIRESIHYKTIGCTGCDDYLIFVMIIFTSKWTWPIVCQLVVKNKSGAIPNEICCTVLFYLLWSDVKTSSEAEISCQLVLDIKIIEISHSSLYVRVIRSDECTPIKG